MLKIKGQRLGLRQFLVITLLSILIMLFFIHPVLALNPTKEFYVNDYADLLTEDTKKHIIEKNISLKNQTGAQIVVVTLPSLEGKNLEGYSLYLARNWGIGDEDKNNGILLLLALKERKFRVEIGYGLEGILPDGKTGRMQDEYIIPYLRNDEWDKGVLNGFNAFLKEVCQYYEIDCDVIVEEAKIGTSKEDMIAGIITLIFVVIYIIIRIRFRGGPFMFLGGGGHHGGFSSGGGFSGGGFSGGGGSFGGGRKFKRILIKVIS